MIKVNIPEEAAVSAAWGDITGTLSNQTDLNQALSDIATVNVTSPISGDGTSLSPLDISINALTQKNVLADNDLILIEDSSDSYNPKKALKSALAGAGGLTNFTESNYLYNTKYGVKLTPNSAQTNVDAVFQPKGNGGIIAQQPDGTATGGNNRGTKAVDLQTSRTNAAQVASGTRSALIGGANNAALGDNTFVGIGDGNSASGSLSSIVNGYQNAASGAYSIIGTGYKNQALYNFSFIGNGRNNISYLHGQGIISGDNATYNKARQTSHLTIQRTTSNTTETEMFLDDSSSRAVLKNNAKWGFIINIVASQNGSVNYAYFTRRGIIRRGANATDTVISALDTIGTDFNTLGGGTIAITADTTNGSLKIAVTGVSTNTIYWQASLKLIEIEN